MRSEKVRRKAGRRALLLALGIAVWGCGSTAHAVAGADADATSSPRWAAGDVLLFRHATAPGGGDPPGMRLGDCATQRNLDESGREQARRLGTALRRDGLHLTALWTSPWCRTRETAALAFPGHDPVDQAAFASFFDSPDRREALSREARALLDRWRQGAGAQGQLVVVTHQVNITALTGIIPAAGEGVQWRHGPEGWRVVGRIPPP